jgi:c-di-GMP-related signal transduction protein
MDVFVARQPILDPQRRTTAYELLFRSGPENVFPRVDGTFASARVLHDSLHVFGLDTLAPRQRIYVNVTRDILLKDVVRVLPPDRIVVEILETVTPDHEVLAVCRRLKRDGYMIALDDFVFRPDYKPLIELADVIKVDFIQTKGDARAGVFDLLGPNRSRMLAEKIETKEQFDEAVKLGYGLFQGYFFARPEMIAARDIPGFKLNYLRLLGLVCEATFDLAKVESVIKQDMALSIKLIRYLNSAALGSRRRIDSIRHAIVLLGEEPFRKWVSLVTLTSMGVDVPGEVIVSSLVRARFCESLGPSTTEQLSPLSCFLVGLLSMVDVVIGRPLDEIVAQLAVESDVHAALIEHTGPLSRLLETAIAYERGDWGGVESGLGALGLTEAVAAESHRQALGWTREMLGQA